MKSHAPVAYASSSPIYEPIENLSGLHEARRSTIRNLTVTACFNGRSSANLKIKSWLTKKLEVTYQIVKEQITQHLVPSSVF